MILQKMPHYVDSILTQEDASAALQDGQVVVGLYTNRENVQSVVHSHPYYEMILPVAGSSACSWARMGPRLRSAAGLC